MKKGPVTPGASVFLSWSGRGHPPPPACRKLPTLPARRWCGEMEACGLLRVVPVPDGIAIELLDRRLH